MMHLSKYEVRIKENDQTFIQTSQVLKFPKSEIFAGDYAKG